MPDYPYTCASLVAFPSGKRTMVGPCLPAEYTIFICCVSMLSEFIKSQRSLQLILFFHLPENLKSVSVRKAAKKVYFFIGPTTFFFFGYNIHHNIITQDRKIVKVIYVLLSIENKKKLQEKLSFLIGPAVNPPPSLLVV